MISQELAQALNQQIIEEMYSANLYLAMSVQCAKTGLPGFSHWLKVQSKEEMQHAERIIDYMVSRNVNPVIGSPDAAPSDWGGPKQMFEMICKHEAAVTGMINRLMDIAISDNDRATQDMLWWFIHEQIEEEDVPAGILGRIKAYGAAGIAIIDQELAKREE